ncbi:hypothetical protein, partial [Helicobacter ibis]
MLIFINGNNGGNVKVLSSTGEELARHEFSGKILRDLKVSQNQSLEGVGKLIDETAIGGFIRNLPSQNLRG